MNDISHHPQVETLMAFASGTLAEALAVVVACHLEACRRCARTARHMEVIGDALLTSLPGTALERQPPMGALGRLEAGEHEVPKTRGVLERLLPDGLQSVSWSALGGGVAQHQFPVSRGSLRLIRVKPGRHLPEHGHTGSELTIVLAGAFSDVTGRFRVGDVVDLDDQIEHHPRAEDESDCICLLASESPMRFKRLVHRLVLPWRGF